MSDHVLFYPTLTPIQQAQLRRYSIENQPEDTFFDHVLGVLYGPKSTDLSNTPLVTAHLYNGNTIVFKVAMNVTATSGQPDAGTSSLIAALNGYVTASQINDHEMAMANFVLVSRMLSEYPTTYNVSYAISFMESFATTEFSWLTFFNNKGTKDSLVVNRATAVYVALYPIISGKSIVSPLRQLLQYAEMRKLSDHILSQYASNNISY